MVFFFTVASTQAQAYFGFPYAGYGVPYNMFGYPSYGSGIGIPYYGGIFGSSYVTAPPPDLSGWTWTGPTTAEYPLPGGGMSTIFVSPAAGYEGLSPYYQQNDGLDSSIGTSPSIYDQYYGWNQPYYGYSWNQPYNYYNYGGANIYPSVYQNTSFGAFQYTPTGFIIPTGSFGFPFDPQYSYDPSTGLLVGHII